MAIIIELCIYISLTGQDRNQRMHSRLARVILTTALWKVKLKIPLEVCSVFQGNTGYHNRSFIKVSGISKYKLDGM